LRYLLIPRSPEGIVYYLGQVARAQEKLLEEGKTDELASVLPWHWDRDPSRPEGGRRIGTFLIGLGSTPSGTSFPSVEFADREYHVPGTWKYPDATAKSDADNDVDDRSFMTMTFVHHLFGLNRKGQEFPSTPVVVAQ
jgi:hypothetical protein